MGEAISKYGYCHFVLPVYAIQLTWLIVIKRDLCKPVVEEIPIFINNYFELLFFSCMKPLLPRKPYCAGPSLTNRSASSLQKCQHFLSDLGSKRGVLQVFKKITKHRHLGLNFHQESPFP